MFFVSSVVVAQPSLEITESQSNNVRSVDAGGIGWRFDIEPFFLDWTPLLWLVNEMKRKRRRAKQVRNTMKSPKESDKYEIEKNGVPRVGILHRQFEYPLSHSQKIRFAISPAAGRGKVTLLGGWVITQRTSAAVSASAPSVAFHIDASS